MGLGDARSVSVALAVLALVWPLPTHIQNKGKERKGGRVGREEREELSKVVPVCNPMQKRWMSWAASQAYLVSSRPGRDPTPDTKVSGG